MSGQNGVKRFSGKKAEPTAKARKFEVGGQEFELLHAVPVTAQALLSDEWWKPRDMVDFLAGCVADEDSDRMRAVFDSKDEIFTSQEVSEMCLWVLLDRPTDSPSGSSDGLTTTGATSEALFSGAAEGTSKK